MTLSARRDGAILPRVEKAVSISMPDTIASRANLRILQVSSYFGGGGADNQTLELARALAELGDTVVLSIPEGSRWETRARELGLHVETIRPTRLKRIAQVWKWRALIRR